MSATPENAAAPGCDTEGETKIVLAGSNASNRTARRNRLGLDYAAAISCPMACSADRRACPWECPAATGEVTA